jgi:2-polyprenyl-6-methoxyphenol hydroxylase-like FAD-dependent oxidoreductase
MSPVGGVGINIAIQDAVCAVNILAEPMINGGNADALLHRVYEKRIGSVKRMQTIQKIAHDSVIKPLLDRKTPINKPFLPLRLLNSFPILRRIPSRIVGLGFGREKITSPEA